MKITPTQRTTIEAALYLTSTAVLWKGRKVALKDPLTLGYLALAASHVTISRVAESELFREFVKELKDNLKEEFPLHRLYKDDEFCRLNFIVSGIFYSSLFALAIKSLFPKCSIIKFDNRAILGTAVGSLAHVIISRVAKKSEAKG
jgi:hypothetical protein